MFGKERFIIKTSHGRALYYSVTDSGTAAEVTTPFARHPLFGAEVKPSGRVSVPGSVILDGTTYPVTRIGDRAFWDCGDLFSVELPDSVTSIGHEAFFSCRALSLVNIPPSVASIGSDAFFGCRSLLVVDIPDAVKVVGEETFWGCRSLADVTLGAGVTTVEKGAFAECSHLQTLTCRAAVPPVVTDLGVFEDVDRGICVRVPAASVDLYRAAYGWKDFVRIVGMD